MQIVGILVSIQALLLLSGDIFGQVSGSNGVVFTIKKDSVTRPGNEIHITSELISEKRYLSINESINRLKYSSKEKSISLKVDDQKTFFVRDVLDQDKWKTKVGKLVFERDKVRVWFEVEYLSAFDSLGKVEIFLSDLDEALFERTSTASVNPEWGVFEILNEYAGEFPNVDGDGILDILFLDIEDNYDGTGGFVAGFFDPVNLTYQEYSNRMDLLYIDLYPTLFVQGEVKTQQALSTIAHEAQHLIHAGYEGVIPEKVFVNEGYSEAIEILAGFTPRSEEEYFKYPVRGLTSWNHSDPLPDYSRASLWTHYLTEQFGPKILKELIQNQLVGIAGYEEVLKRNFGASFTEVFKDWGVAMVLNNTQINPVYGYKHSDRKRLRAPPVSELYGFPSVINGHLPSLSHALFGFPLSNKIEVYQGRNNGNNFSIQGIESGPVSEFKIKNTVVGPHAYLYASDPIHSNLFLLISNLNSNTSDSVSDNLILSIDGEKSGSEQIWKYGDGFRDVFYLNASYLTLSGTEQKIGLAFPPQNQPYWLEGILVNTVFESELQGSGVSSDAERDFNLCVYTLKDNKPDKQMIPEQTYRVKREKGKLIDEYISLESEYGQLAAIKDSILIVLSNDGDDNNYVAIGMDKGERSESVFFEKGSWVKLSDKKIGSASINNFNPMIQAKVVVSQQNPEYISTIKNINYDYDNVKVVLNPVEEADSNSIRIIAQLPNGDYKRGEYLNKYNEDYEFGFPVLVNGTYTFTSSYTTNNGEKAFRDMVEWEIDILDGFQLQNNYPNPFNPDTKIPFTLIEKAEISWQVFDVLGRKVMEIPGRVFESGEHINTFNFSSLSNGAYFVRAVLTRSNSNPIYRTQKVMLIK